MTYIELSPSVGAPGTLTPVMNGVGAAGTSASFSREDHVHPSDTSRVAKAGDTMTGTLNVTMASGYGVTLTGTTPAHVYGLAVAAGSGGFTLDDVTRGVPLLSISGTTGAVSVGGSFGSSQGSITAGSALTTGTYYFGNSGTKYLNYDGTNFTLIGGSLNVGTGPASYNSLVAGLIVSAATANTGTYYFGNTGTKYLSYDGANFNLVGGALITDGQILLGSANNYFITDGANLIHRTGGAHIFQNLGGGNYLTLGSASAAFGVTVTCTGITANRTDGQYHYTLTRAGYRSWGMHIDTAGAFNLDDISLPAPRLTIDIAGALLVYGGAYKPGGGAWTASSDARIKNELGDYTRGLDEIVALRPVYYTYKGNDTPSAPAHFKTGDEEKDEISASLPLTVPYPNSAHKTVAEAGTKYAGLIAQEVEAVIPEMVTKRSGYIDGAAVEDLRDLDTTPLIFALINAVKELKARIEVLEAP